MRPAPELTELLDQLRWDRRRHPRSPLRRDYSRSARLLASECELLVTAGQAAVAVPVLRRAVDRVSAALRFMDDSSGIVGDDLRVLMEGYARACCAAPPPPAALAGWLVGIVFDGPGWPQVRLADFAAALGERGLAQVSALVEERAAVAEPGSWHAVYATRDLREQLAEVSGDVDRYVAVLAESLNRPDQYLRITRALRAAGRPVEAIAWARRGLASTLVYHLAARLRDEVVDVLLEQGDPAAAMAERRTAFERHPTAEAYRALLDTAGRIGDRALGADVEPDVGAWAVDVLVAKVAGDQRWVPELVKVLLAEGRVEQAWQVGLEHRDRFHASQLLELLRLRRTSHPADVVQPYRELIEEKILDSGDKNRYRRALELLAELRAVYRALEDDAAFGAYVAQLRIEHRRRPTFIRRLDAAFAASAGRRQVVGGP